MTIEAHGYLARLGTPLDAEVYQTYLNRNADRFNPSTPASASHTLDDIREEFSNAESCFTAAHKSKFLIFKQSSQQIVGTFGFYDHVPEPLSVCWAGAGIDAEYEGKGILTLIAPLVFDHLKTSWKLHRLQASHEVSNTRSANLVQRLGFTKVGLISEMLLVNGKWQDHILYSKLL